MNRELGTSTSRIQRACGGRIAYRDLDWCEHEVDYLDGVLAVQRALDERSITLRRARSPKTLELRGAFRVLA